MNHEQRLAYIKSKVVKPKTINSITKKELIIAHEYSTDYDSDIAMLQNNYKQGLKQWNELCPEPCFSLGVE